LPPCTVHRVIPIEEMSSEPSTDDIVCEKLFAKTGISLMRSINSGWFTGVEYDLSPTSDSRAHCRAIQGDAFLVKRRIDQIPHYTAPEISLPTNWRPSDPTASVNDKRKEKLRAHRELNCDRPFEMIEFVWDYLTVYMGNGNWRRKTVVYENGTPSPFQHAYYDTR
jgi:hypothetical protein